MGFFTPWFFAGLAVLGLPVWLHLLKKHKSTPLPFSSLMFFERRIQSSVKHRRLQYLVLFALRMALLALLVLAFANPFVYRKSAAVTAGRKLVLAAIDNSFSMRQGNRLESARAGAVRLLSGVRESDRAQVIAFAAGTHMLSDVTNDRAVLRSAAQGVEPTDERGSFAELARTVRPIAQSAKTLVELHLFSDLQPSGMPQNFNDLRLPENVQLIPHPIAQGRTANFAVEAVNVPHRVYSGRKVRVQATIAGFGTERAARRVALVLNGREIDSKAVDVPPNGRASAEFLSLDAPFGMNRGEVRIDAADTLPDDDRYYFSLERAEARKALFVREPSGTRSILYFRAALEAGGDAAFSLEDVTVDQAAGRNPANYAFIVLSDVGPLPPGFEKALGDYVRRGGALLVALGRSSLGNARVPVADRSISSTRYSPSEGERFQTAVWLDSGHPSIGPASQWQDIRFFQAVKVEPGRARVAVRLSDETPLLLDETVGEGRVLVFASTFDNVANDFPLHGAFVPFIEKTAAYLARLDEGAGAFLVGSHYDLRATRGRGESIEVLDPKGARALSLEESTRAETLRLANTGYYDVRRPSGRHDLVAVNADRKESDLDVIPAETLALWRNTARPGESGGAADGEPERKPSPLWWYVLIAALAVAVAESLLGNKHLGVESGEKEAAA